MPYRYIFKHGFHTLMLVQRQTTLYKRSKVKIKQKTPIIQILPNKMRPGWAMAIFCWF